MKQIASTVGCCFFVLRQCICGERSKIHSSFSKECVDLGAIYNIGDGDERFGKKPLLGLEMQFIQRELVS